MRAFFSPICFAAPLLILASHSATAQTRFFAGAGPGIAILSGGAKADVNANAAALSSYAAVRGAMVHTFAGYHLSEYVSVQAAWSANRNALTLSASLTGTGFYQQQRSSRQQNLGVDLLVYFRDRRSIVRPFLSVGPNAMWFTSEPAGAVVSSGNLPPPGKFSETAPGLRVAAGMDVMHPGGWGFRYAFLENMQRNVIGATLTPPARPVLMNFQHVFGFVKYF
jgi:hypothetical protein